MAKGSQTVHKTCFTTMKMKHSLILMGVIHSGVCLPNCPILSRCNPCCNNKCTSIQTRIVQRLQLYLGFEVFTAEVMKSYHLLGYNAV
jgi:hypothetical protein